MADENYKYNVEILIFLSIIFSHILNNKFVEGIRSSSSAMKNYTILAGNGEIVDCVDIYKQPAFNHPLLKNHTMQMKPSFAGDELKEGKKEEIFQVWQNYGKCPKGTIPIARAQIKERKTRRPLIPDATNPNARPGHEYAQVTEVGAGPYWGANANFNVWRPGVEFDGEFSLSQIWIAAGLGHHTNTIEVGWQVRYTYNNPKLFVYWTRDNYGRTGCYNVECPGFVHTSSKYGFNLEIRPVSSYNGPQYSLPLFVRRDTVSGHWWLRVHDEYIGYWPKNIFTGLSEPAKYIIWGGEVMNKKINGRHTATQMGSGHFSREGHSRAAEIDNLGYIDNLSNTRDAQHIVRHASHPSCYDIQIPAFNHSDRVHVFYGGPGRSPHCP